MFEVAIFKASGVAGVYQQVALMAGCDAKNDSSERAGQQKNEMLRATDLALVKKKRIEGRSYACPYVCVYKDYGKEKSRRET
jgi:hypothetical protein